MTPETTKQTPQAEQDTKDLNEAITRINAALAETKTLIDPYLENTAHGILPRVRIMKMLPEVPTEIAKEIQTNETKTSNRKPKNT